MPDKPAAPPAQPAPAAAPSGLNPQDMADRGQTLSAGERARIAGVEKLAETRAKADEEKARAEASVRSEIRAAAGAELDEQRKAALEDAEAQRAAFREAHTRMQPLAVDPATLAIEGALNRTLAAALKQDETVPGGLYVVNGRKVDADGNALE